MFINGKYSSKEEHEDGEMSTLSKLDQVEGEILPEYHNLGVSGQSHHVAIKKIQEDWRGLW